MGPGTNRVSIKSRLINRACLVCVPDIWYLILLFNFFQVIFQSFKLLMDLINVYMRVGLFLNGMSFEKSAYGGSIDHSGQGRVHKGGGLTPLPPMGIQATMWENFWKNDCDDPQTPRPPSLGKNPRSTPGGVMMPLYACLLHVDNMVSMGSGVSQYAWLITW